MEDLTPEESELFDSLPRPPRIGDIRIRGVFIVEWLLDSPGEPRTGFRLHEFLEVLKPGWSTYVRCSTKADLLVAIDSAAAVGKILHIESHGNDEGIDDGSGTEFLSWQELTPALQALNKESGGNLLVFLAACTGFAGILALAQGPRAPAVALVGPTDALSAYESAAGAKSFYRTMVGGTAHLQAMADASTGESGVHFEPEPIAILAWEAWVHSMILEARPEERQTRIQHMRRRLIDKGHTADEADHRLVNFDENEARLRQATWDHFFMIDLRPEEAARFGVDFLQIARRIAAFHGRAL